MHKFLAAAGVLLASALSAHADIIFSLNAPVSVGNGYYAYTYNAQLAAGQLDPVSNGTPVQFGTIYDFGPMFTYAGGLVVYSATGILGSSFDFSFALTNSPASTPTGMTLVNDNPSLTNIRLTYTGTTRYDVAGSPTTFGPGATTLQPGANNLGTFTVYSPYASINPALSYDGQTYTGTNNTQQANQGLVGGPLVPSVPTTAVTPEPSSLALLGTGLLSVVGVLRKRLA